MSEEELRSALDRGRWDAILSDNRMPRFSAKDALAMVRARDRTMPFVVVSGHLTDAQRAELEAGGASHFVDKGDLPRLVAAVRAALVAGHRERGSTVRLERPDASRNVERADREPGGPWSPVTLHGPSIDDTGPTRQTVAPVRLSSDRE